MTAEVGFMGEVGERLLALGYPILPIIPGEKRPGQHRQGRWICYSNWTKHGERGTTQHELAIWKQWPDAGVGIACGPVVGIDIDVTDPATADRMQVLAFSILGPTPAVRVGQSPKRILVYRASAPFKGAKARPLEVLGQGQQFVAYAIHPGTGRPYQWTGTSLIDLRIEDLPVITEEQARVFLAQGAALLGGQAEARPTLPTSAAASFQPHAEAYIDAALRGEAAKVAGAPKGERNNTLNAAAFALGTMIGAGLSRDLVESRLLSAALTAGLTEREASPTIKSGLNGGVAHPRQIPDQGQPAGPHPAQGLIDKTVTTPAPVERPPVLLEDPGFDPLEVDGVLKGLANHMLATSTRPQPVLSVANSLVALGALMGRRYRTETNLRSNLYIVGVADSGSGKNHSREIINEVFTETGLGRFLAGNRIGSGVALLNSLFINPACLYQQDEFGMFLQAAADRRRSPRHITEILDLMTELFSAAGTIFLGTEYAGRDSKNPRKDINQPCLCLYGVTTPHNFWGALQSANVVDGSLARFLVLKTPDDYPEENTARTDRSLPDDVVAGVKAIAMGGKSGEGNLAGVMPGIETAVEPFTVPYSAEARQYFQQLSRDVTARLRRARGTPFTSFLARITENAVKVALVCAVSANPQAPEIRLRDAVWATRLVQHSVATVMEHVDRHVADNPVERNHKRLLDIIRQAGAEGVTKSELWRRSRWLCKRERDEILASLQEAGDIQSWTVQSAGPKPVTLFGEVG